MLRGDGHLIWTEGKKESKEKGWAALVMAIYEVNRCARLFSVLNEIWGASLVYSASASFAQQKIGFLLFAMNIADDSKIASFC
ncbi:MAG: hypothetical protein PF441_13235 [Desulfuromusa sp.]|jgi:hypothetical protein|nr:hypothetical protein [Desulfuromusa sp.]